MFVSRPIEPVGGFDPATLGRGEPALPAAFVFDGDTLTVSDLRKQWRTTKEDRGDVYVKRHWFEFLTGDGRLAVVYFDRGARKGAPRWFLYTLDVSSS